MWCQWLIARRGGGANLTSTVRPKMWQKSQSPKSGDRKRKTRDTANHVATRHVRHRRARSWSVCETVAIQLAMPRTPPSRFENNHCGGHERPENIHKNGSACEIFGSLRQKFLPVVQTHAESHGTAIQTLNSTKWFSQPLTMHVPTRPTK